MHYGSYGNILYGFILTTHLSKHAQKHQNILAKWCNYSTMVSTLDNLLSTMHLREGRVKDGGFILTPGPALHSPVAQSPLRVACIYSLSNVSQVEEETPGPK